MAAIVPLVKAKQTKAKPVFKGIQLNEDDQKVLEALQKKLGVTQYTSIVRMALRRMAELEGLRVA